MLTLRQIEVIRAIMITGSVGGAARLLNVSSPGISRVMKHAEALLGLKLFSKKGGRYTPTREASDIFTQINGGPNGAGKSTMFKTVFGLLPVRTGSVRFDGRETTGFSPRQMIDAGVCYVPQGRRSATASRGGEMSERRSLVGLIGANIMGSLSPALHEDAFAAAGIHGYYHLMDLDRLPGRRLEDLLGAVKAAGFDGVNVTFPCKQAVMPLLDEISAEAQQIGAVNSVTIAASGRTTGYNTDRSGFRGNFEEGLGRGCVEGKTAVLVGAGGAGRAVAFALMDLGAATVLVHDTDMGRAASLVADLALHKGASRARLAGSLADAIAAAAGVVNATPIGMSGFAGNPVPVEALRPQHWVADVIYTPIETELIKAAQAKGARTLTGGGMCVHQAVEAFRLFTGLATDIQRMHRTFARALAARDAAPAPVTSG
ncbi:MAG TPA: shikimate dehydrogenase [Hyphomicrobiaceae bacterium]|nr:shikimate dehydrogenase [Hyphomicrobiaceae bacterium]